MKHFLLMKYADGGPRIPKGLQPLKLCNSNALPNPYSQHKEQKEKKLIASYDVKYPASKSPSIF